MQQQISEDNDRLSSAEALGGNREAGLLERPLILLFVAAATLTFVWFAGTNLRLLTASWARVGYAVSQTAVK